MECNKEEPYAREGGAHSGREGDWGVELGDGVVGTR